MANICPKCGEDRGAGTWKVPWDECKCDREKEMSIEIRCPHCKDSTLPGAFNPCECGYADGRRCPKCLLLRELSSTDASISVCCACNSGIPNWIKEHEEAAFNNACKNDPINHPSHYTSHPTGIECIDIIEHFTANVANVIKYMWRAGLKEGSSDESDLRKALWYVRRELKRRGYED